MPNIIEIDTTGRGLFDITSSVIELARSADIGNGVVHLFIQHTSASLLIQENADPDVRDDLVRYFDRLAPENADYTHIAEGADDMPAHIKSALTASTLTIPIGGGRLLLGAWQGVYVFEHRRASHRRRVVATFISEA